MKTRESAHSSATKTGQRLGCGAAALLALATALPAFAEPPAAAPAEAASTTAPRLPGLRLPTLEQKVDILTEEVQRLREKLVLPETETMKSAYGLGPAASKIYRTERGLSIGGYGEAYVGRILKDKVEGRDFATGDALRYVQYVGYKFTDKLLINAEVEVEHAGPSDPNYAGKMGEVALEFMYLDYLAHPAANLRAGLLLVPMGFMSEIHEPPFFHGVLRPAVETVILPSTWSALGAGLFGELFPGLTYKLYAVSGLNAKNFSAEGWRDGRQGGNRALTESIAVVGRVDYNHQDVLTVGASAYFGPADHGQLPFANTWLTEAHAQLRWRGLELRGLFAYGNLSNAGAVTQALYPSSSEVLGSDLFGAYAEVAYDLFPLLSKKSQYLAPYFRFEAYNTQWGVPELAGRSAERARNVRIFEAGLTYKPNPQIVLKLSYRDSSSEAGAPVADLLLFGVGFVY